jgi:hypothetical protein
MSHVPEKYFFEPSIALGRFAISAIPYIRVIRG